MKRLSFYFFLLIATVHLVASLFKLELMGVATKPMIMVSLIIYYAVHVSQRNKLFMSAMMFCWLGDVLLMFQDQEIFFILGLAAFLAGHVLYIFCYRSLQWSQATQPLLPTQKIRFSLPLILIGTGLVTVLFPYLGNLRIPVMIYALVITVMTMQGLFRFGFTSRKSFWFIFSGALLFMLSDSLLAINKFMHPIPLASFNIMVTYLSAQYLIAEGAIIHPTNK